MHEVILHDGELCFQFSISYLSGINFTSLNLTLFRSVESTDPFRIIGFEPRLSEFADYGAPLTARSRISCVDTGPVKYRAEMHFTDRPFEARDFVLSMPGPPQAILGTSYSLPTAEDVTGHLTWDALAEGSARGHSEVTGYQIQYRVHGEEDWHDINPPHTGTDRRYDDNVVWKFAPTVHFRVRATNIATELNPAEPGAWSDPITVTNLPALDLNSDNRFSAPDMLVMYYTYYLPELLGDGSKHTGFPIHRSKILTTVEGLSEADDTALLDVVNSAAQLRRDYGASTMDINRNGQLNADDALIMYYALTFRDLLGDGETGGMATFRNTFLSGLAGTTNPTPEDLLILLRRANTLVSD